MSFAPTAGHTAPPMHRVAWYGAMSAGSMERLIERSHPDGAIGGPRGTRHCAPLLRERVDRANVRLEPGRIFHDAGPLVVEHEAQWRLTQTGGPDGVQRVASSDCVGRDDLVASVVCYPDVVEALRAVYLSGPRERRPY